MPRALVDVDSDALWREQISHYSRAGRKALQKPPAWRERVDPLSGSGVAGRVSRGSAAVAATSPSTSDDSQVKTVHFYHLYYSNSFCSFIMFKSIFSGENNIL